jgi:5'-nucleotidase
MRILLSNDDGYRARGLHVMFEILSEVAECVVVAPEHNCSGASNSLTLRSPLRATERARGFIAVDGTPTDCVHLALTGYLDFEPDIVISGINDGPNLGDDVLYSGTVAAAMEGRHLGRPAMAVSMASYSPQHFETAAIAAHRILEEIPPGLVPGATVLNINCPDRPFSELAGIKDTRLGNRHRAEAMIRAEDPRGESMYWIGPAGPAQDAGDGTDFHAVEHGYVSVTPLHVDLTRHESRAQLGARLATIVGPTSG